MDKVEILVHKKKQKGYFGTLGMPYLLSALRESDLFEMGIHEDGVRAAKNERGMILYCNDKKVYLDFWEYPAPAYTHGIKNFGFDLIIKIQDKDIPFKNCYRYITRKGMMATKNENGKRINITKEELQAHRDKMCPWTFFPSKSFKKFIGKEEELQEGNTKEIFGFFCGKRWKGRGKVWKHLEANDIECIASDQGLKKGRKLTDEEFLERMKKSKFGIVLAGRASTVTDPKNRREIDYMMLKKPLLLNYRPYYYNELIEGKHYIYIDQNTDLNELEKRYNIDEIAENGYQWYLNNASPEGAAKVFRQILSEKLGI